MGFGFSITPSMQFLGTVDFCCLGRAKEHHDERGKPNAGPASCSWFGWYGLGAMSFFFITNINEFNNFLKNVTCFFERSLFFG